MTTEPEGIVPYDLVLPSKLLVPQIVLPFDAFTPEGKARIDAALAEANARREALTVALARAMDAWEELWDRVEDNIIATSVLLIHKPTTDADHRPVVCTHCEQHNGYEDTEPADWPCTTYQAVVRAAEPVDIATCQDLNALGPIRPPAHGSRLEPGDGEPPFGSRVRDAHGDVWVNTGYPGSRVNWEQEAPDGAGDGEVESWGRVNEYAPLTLLQWGYEP